MFIQTLFNSKAFMPPTWLADNTHLLCVVGSHAYGVATEESDLDIYGFCIPPKHIIFPHTIGHIAGFGTKPQSFDQYQEGKDGVDLTVYNIVKYFELCRNANPNMVDSLFVSPKHIKQITPVGQQVLSAKRLFLSKKCWHTFRGYAHAQMSAIDVKKREHSKRRDIIEKYGYDIKHAYHIVRLMRECQEILETGDLTLDANAHELRSIRHGDWTLEQLKDWFTTALAATEDLYNTSKLPYAADESALLKVLTECLEHHYGSIENFSKQSRSDEILATIRKLVN